MEIGTNRAVRVLDLCARIFISRFWRFTCATEATICRPSRHQEAFSKALTESRRRSFKPNSFNTSSGMRQRMSETVTQSRHAS